VRLVLAVVSFIGLAISTYVLAPTVPLPTLHSPTYSSPFSYFQVPWPLTGCDTPHPMTVGHVGLCNSELLEGGRHAPPRQDAGSRARQAAAQTER
jgi:hypothetical protein